MKRYFLQISIIVLLGIDTLANVELFEHNVQNNLSIVSINFFKDTSNRSIPDVYELQDILFENYNKQSLKKDSTYWLRIVVQNTKSTKLNYYMYFNSMISLVELYQKNEDGSFVIRKGGALVPMKKRSVGGYIKDKVEFNAPATGKTVLFIRILNNTEHTYKLENIEIVPVRDFEKTVYNLNILQGIFQGMMLILLLLNFILYLFSRNRLYLLYSLYIFFSSLLFLFNFQISEVYIFPKHPKADMTLLWSVYIAQFIYILFFIELLKNENVPVWRKYVIYYARAIFIMCILILITGLIEYHSAIFISDIYTLMNALFVMITFLIFFRKVALTARIVLIGAFIMVIGALITTIAGFYRVAISNLAYYQAGVIIEVILFSIAVNYTYAREHLDRVKILYQNSKLELEKVKREKENLLLQSELDQKNRMLTTEAMKMGEKEQLISDTIKHLSHLSKTKLNKTDKQNIISKLKMNHSPNYWDEFEISFNRIHPLFYKKLHEKFNNLTPNECKMCAFLKLNLSTKKIANITGKSANTIDVARGRLRKKLGLTSSDNLNTFFSQFD